MKSDRAITLIALVITIIVLLILAGVSIATLTGDNGILTRANDSKVESRGATVEELKNLWKMEKETDRRTGTKTAKTLEEFVNSLVEQENLTEDERDKILGNEEKGVEAQYQITIGKRTIKFLEDVYFSIDGVEYSVREGTTWEEFGDYQNSINWPNGCNMEEGVVEPPLYCPNDSGNFGMVTYIYVSYARGNVILNEEGNPFPPETVISPENYVSHGYGGLF